MNDRTQSSAGGSVDAEVLDDSSERLEVGPGDRHLVRIAITRSITDLRPWTEDLFVYTLRSGSASAWRSPVVKRHGMMPAARGRCDAATQHCIYPSSWDDHCSQPPPSAA